MNLKLLGTRVINVRHTDGLSYEYIGRGSPYGNPYTHLALGATKAQFQVATREDSIERCEQYVLNNEVILGLIDRLRGKLLGCYCDPLPCHGTIYVLLVATFEWMRAEGFGVEPEPATPEGRTYIRQKYLELKQLVADNQIPACLMKAA